MGFQKAIREKIFVKTASIGASGSGKTYSNLRLATGMVKEIANELGVEPFSSSETKIAFIDSEAGRGRYYADEFEYDYMELSQPFTPEKYIEAIEDAVDAGYKVLVIDSITHEWSGKGGCLEIVSNMPGNNSFIKWNKVTPRHNKFIDAILSSPIHIFVTIRGKDKYVLEDEGGKSVPKKIGLGGVQRDDTEYEYTLTFNVSQDTHIAEATKDNTHIFENKYEVLTEKDGKLLYKWANSGVEGVKQEKEKDKPVIKSSDETKEYIEEEKNSENNIQVTEEIDVPMLKTLITESAKELTDEKQKEFKAVIKNELGYLNYNKCEDLQQLTTIYNKLQDLQ